ncbi:Mannosylfructose-phosphate synthase [Sedimentisphaera cyanobacteriorum]|uniref:Mannosylfructose-phosphate synthase n=1 Tax=Sedimentisphaera cyanobacteriorum TaxID=1940790 RepID=A0A1Q2HNE5_9BACT|nr:glycosyltransferase family 4 protein [Sedimentisphaera cyanobacteriorum]AQQ08952.1 Mannosylfructose-phosphate synthase [Sedimentisphaera cyanobacteriorum]
MKIAIVTNRFYPEVGGAETNIYYQACSLAKQHEVAVFCPKRIDAADYEKLSGFELFRLKDWKNPNGEYPNIKTETFMPSVFFKILTGGYDVVMYFPALSKNNMLGFLAAKLSGKKNVLCCFDWLDYSQIILQTGDIDPNIMEREEARWYQKIFLKRFDYIFAISNKEIEFFKKYNRNVGYSPVPIRLEEYDNFDAPNPRSKYGIEENEFVFLSLGRVCRIKGQDIALKAFAEVADKLPGSKFVFVGRQDYDPQITSEMKALIKQNGLEDRVLFTGMVQREEVIGWLRHSDIHVIPVRFMNSGAVVVESWISGTPVLQSDVVDPNLVQEDVNGYTFRRADVSHLAEKMEKAFQNRDAFPDLAREGEKLVREKYTYQYLTNLYVKTFESLINQV